MRAIQESTERLARQASEWVEALMTAGTDERTAFVEWLKESPRNVREYLLMVAMDRELESVDPQRRQDVKRILTEAGKNIVPLSAAAEPRIEHQQAKILRWTQGRRLAMAATTAALGLGLAWWTASSYLHRDTYTTAIGEQRTIELSDGSIVQLNTHSVLKARVTKESRDLRLIDGEAVFKVHSDPARPFIVHTDTATIQALGTQFNVYRNATGTKVSVLEGSVRVSPLAQNQPATVASAGEETSIAAAGKLVKTQTPDIAASVTWRQRRLVFRSDTLEHISAEFNRYNRAPRVHLKEPSIGERRYTGTFDADDPEALALLLSQEKDLSVQTGHDEIVIAPR